MMTALMMSKSAILRTEKIRNSFEDVKDRAINFDKTINDNAEIENIFMKEEIPTRRMRRVKIRPGEKASDEVIQDAWENFRINQFLVICDTTTQSLTNRFENNENECAIKDMGYFHPRMFETVSKDDNADDGDDEDDEDDDGKIRDCVPSKKACNNCLKCCFQMISW